MIQVRELTKVFGDFPAVRGVSFEVRKGETFALLGPNGSGKTTVLKSLVGLVPATSGQILIDGIDIGRDQRRAKAFMSYLPQYLHFQDHLTAREVMDFYCRLRKLPATRIDEVLGNSNFNFNGFTDKQVNQFSGGMVQRLGLAVACLPKAPILLLDEPTASLDPERAIQFREFLMTLKRAGTTIVFTSHVLTDVEELADRVAILVEGKLVAVESIASLREGLMINSQMCIALRNPRPEAAEVALRCGANTAALDGNSLVVTSVPGSRLEILTAVRAEGFEVDHFTTEEPSIENIYLNYIRSEQQEVRQ